ncbi:unnamed protein product [Closterium sp. Naga37s-1]|nr:unnamed protein product [Closterium sp. Naga37s-1]
MASPTSYVTAICRPADAEASEAEAAISGSKSLSRTKPLVAVQAELQTRSVKGKERGSGKESQGSIRRVGDEEGGETGGEDVSDARRAGNVGGKSEGGGSKSCRTKGCKEEEEEAVAVIAGVLREKFGPQIVKEELEERGSGIGSSEGEEGVGRLKVEEGDDEEEEEVEEEEEAEVEPCEENAPPTTSPSTPPPPLNSRRVVSRSSLLSLYRFFSSHLGISSPSIVSSLLATYPQLLRSNPTNDFLPRVRLLQSYGISDADIAHMTLSNPAWLRSSLPQIQNMLELLLGKGIRRSRLGLVLRRGRNLLCREARSTNLDILVEKAGVPVDKLGSSSIASSVLRRGPNIIGFNKETLLAKLQFFVELVGEEAAGRMVRSFSQTSVGDRRGVSIGAGKERSKLGSVSDKVEGVEGIEWGAEEGKSGPLYGVVAGNDEPGERVVTERQLLDLEGSKKRVCLQQFLLCTDKQFDEKFGVKV